MKRTACEVQNRNNNSGCGDSNSDRDNNNTYSNPPNKVRRAGNATPLLFGNDARPFETNNCPRELQVAWENVSKDYQAVAVSEQENDVNRYSKSQNIFVCKIRKAHSFHTFFFHQTLLSRLPLLFFYLYLLLLRYRISKWFSSAKEVQSFRHPPDAVRFCTSDIELGAE